MTAQILNTFNKTFVYEKFDANNMEHVAAYVCLKRYGRQHPTLRFYLEDPFTSIPHLMESRIADAYLAKVANAVSTATTVMDQHLARVAATQPEIIRHIDLSPQ